MHASSLGSRMRHARQPHPAAIIRFTVSSFTDAAKQHGLDKQQRANALLLCMVAVPAAKRATHKMVNSETTGDPHEQRAEALEE